MSDKLFAKNPVYPVFGILATLAIFFSGMYMAEKMSCFWFALGVYVLLLIYGYWRACLSMIPAAAIMAVVFCGVTWLATKDPLQTRYAMARILTFCVAIIPGMGLPPEALTRNLTRLHFPRLFVLGMMITFSFFPMLHDEVSRVREAMKTRGAGSMWKPQVFYRAFLIPLIMRLVDISDTLSLSVETRGFDQDSPCSIYRPIKLRVRDVVFLVLVGAGIGLAVAL